MDLGRLTGFGSKSATVDRQRGLHLFEKALSRPWLSCDLVFTVDCDDMLLEHRKEYPLEGGHRYEKITKRELSSNNMVETALIQNIGIPNLGLDFNTNQALMGHPQPVVNFGGFSVTMALPASYQNKTYVARNGVSVLASKYLGAFGAIYEDQFTSYGTLALRRSKPIASIELWTNILDGIGPLTEYSAVRIPLFKFKGCRFGMPTPAQSDASSQNPLIFNVNVMFDDYDILGGITSKGIVVTTSKLYEASKAIVIAKAQFTEKLAKETAIAAASAAGLNF